MRIIHIIPHFYPYIGGMELRVKDLTKKLTGKGHEIEIFTSDMGCEEGRLKSTKNLKINYLKSWEFAHTPIILSLFWRLMKIPKDSIMHVHVAQAFVPEIVYLVSRIRGIPYIAHVRAEVEPSGKFGFLLGIYKKIFLKKVLQNANKIIALNEDYKNLIIKKYNILKNKLKVIPNATTYNIIKKNINKNVSNILFVGRLSIEKNVPKIVEAIVLLKNEVILNIVGEGEKRNEIKELIKERKLKNVILHGRKEGVDLLKIYKKADIFLLPSEYECFSSTLLEAMATGTPIIASDIPGTRNIIKNNYNGLLVKPTAEEIAKAIEKLIKNSKLRKRLVENGLKEIEKYSWNKVVKQTEEVYRVVIKEHKNKISKK